MEESHTSADDDRLYLGGLAELIASLTGRFVNVACGGLDVEIDHALRLLGQFAEVDRSYVFRFSADRERVTNTHEWCREGVEPSMHRIQDLPVPRFEWALQPLLRGEVLYVEDVEQLPAGAFELKDELRRQGVRAMLNVPLQCAGQALGFLGFDAVGRVKRWRDRDIALLRVAGEIIANAMERDVATARLRYQVDLETLVGNISSRFVNVPEAALDTEIDEALAAIGRFTGVDRSYVFRLSRDGQRLTNTHEWCAEGIQAHIDRLGDLPADAFGHSMSLMRRGEVFYVADVSKLPESAAAERAEFEREAIQTLINVPVMVEGRMAGFLGLDAVRERKLWTPEDLRLLKLIGEIFAGALQRREAEDRLRRSLEEKELLLREIHHRVKNNLQIVDSLLYLQAHALRGRADPKALEAFAESQNRIRAMAKIHELLYRSDDLGSLPFGTYLAELAKSLTASSPAPDDLVIDVCPCAVMLDLDRAIPCGLIVNELVTNSLTHGYPDGGPGRIGVCLESGDGEYELTVVDDGSGFAVGGTGSPDSLGLRLVHDLARQLGGRAVFESGLGGTRVTVTF